MNYKQRSCLPIKTVITLIALFSFSMSYAKTSKRVYECNYYARSAVTQQKQNRQAHCDFKGLRWSDDKAGHAKWCVTVRRSITDSEEAIRNKQLKTCFTEKAALSNRENQPNIPYDCKDRQGHYTAIKSIYSWYRYYKEIRTPVENGLITMDFNADNRPDYVFIEQSKAQAIQLTACFSQGLRYKRMPTRIGFSATGDALSSYGHYISLKDNALQILFTYFGHNEGSSSAQGAYVYNQALSVFELKNETSSHAGIPFGGNEGETYPIYVPKPPAVL
ncbi:MAG: hypothetical protein KAG20_00030 [Cocleimonas sp.]|nr:hypothetical protein [Cocleimonas sp.]